MLPDVRLITTLGELRLDEVQVDTGLNYAVHGHPDALRGAFGREWDHETRRLPKVPVLGFGGPANTWMWQAALRVGPWTLQDCELRISLKTSQGPNHWLVGLPVLRHFDIHMRTDQHAILPGPVLTGPDPGTCHVNYLNSKAGHLPGQWLPTRST